MFQFSLSPGGLPGLAQGAQAPSAQGADGTGLAGLLQQLEGADPGFSAELQSLLMQLSPEMLRRLDEMLAGGMSLPQAASRLLGEQAFDDPSDTFAQLLRQGQAGADEISSLEAGGEVQAVPSRDAFSQLLDKLPATLPTRADLTQSMTAQAAMPTLTSPVSPGPLQLPPQLATNLLAMGVPQPVGSKGWEGAIADRVMWMVQGEQQFARLKLNPPNLGPLEVRVSVHQDQTSVSFLANQAAVREALEAALPRLREMFDQQSLQLVRADVSDPGPQQGDHAQDPPARPGGGRPGTGEPVGTEEPDGAAQAPLQASTRLVDLFV